jgi:chitodextrinase
MKRVWKCFNLDRASSSAAASGHFTRALLIASSFVLLLLAAMISAQARAAATGSDKFIPTFLVYSGPALVAADAPRLAKFDLIDIDRFRYADIGSGTWAAIKAANPAVQIYLYEMGSESPSHLDSTPQLNLNGLGRHNVSRGHFMGSLNGNRPDLFLLDSTGSRVYNLGSSNPGAGRYWYLMDFGATAYQSYWVAAVKADIVDQPWAADGVFANSCLTRASDGGYSAVPSLYPTGAAWSDAMNDFASSITAGLFGYGQKLWCNRGGSRSVEGAAAWLALDQSASPPDAVMEEGAFAVSWGAGAVEFYPESEWKRQVDTVRAINNSKVTVMSHTKLLEGQAGTDNYGRSVTYWQALWYSLGSFLLAKNDVLGNAYFMFRGGSGYNKIWWHDEYDNIDLGKAVGPYAVRRIGSVNIYWREFERGYVYVNPTATAVGTLTLPQAGRLLTHANMTAAPDSIPSVNKISLNSRRAAIILKVASAPAPDTTAPTVPAGFTASAVSPSQVNLSWSPSTDNVGVTGYTVYLNDVTLASTATTSFSHTGLTAGATYNYRVSAFDAVPNHSAWTAAVAVTTPTPADTTPPSTPTGLTASAITSASFTLSWDPATDNVGVVSSRVYQNGTLIIPADTTRSPTISGLSPSTTYSFTVAAVDAAGNASPQSAPLSVTTAAAPDTTPPSTPTGLTASAITSTSFTLSWDAATDNVGVVSSRVYRNGTLIIPADTTRSPTISGLSPSTTYSFTVAAVDAAGNASPQSAPLSVTTAAAPAGTACANPAGGYQGFGRNTTGGAGLTVYRVTNLNDSGAGSLRDAVSQGNRCVVFDVAGTISLSSALLVRGANITIDGFTAPSPGISLTGWGFDWHYLRGVANIIARGIRIRGTVGPESAGADGFQIVGVNNFVIDHVSIDQWGDGSIDVAGEDGVPAQNGTIQWTVFGKGRDVEDKSLLVKYGSRRISLHHNLFINSHDRSPYCAWFDDPALLPPTDEIVCDFRNNLVLGYDWTGTSIRHRATANVVNNYFFSAIAPGAGAALYIAEGGIAYASGNYSPIGANINAEGNRATPFPADVPTTTDAITAGQQIVAQGGARGPNFGLDAADLNYVGQVSLP